MDKIESETFLMENTVETDLSFLDKEQPWDLEVGSKQTLFKLHLRDVWSYRDLLVLFVKRDFVAQYKQTILGPIWQFLQPIVTTLMFLLVFGHFANLPTDGIAPMAFYMAGTTVWNYFSNCLSTVSNTFVNNADIYGKVYFPRLVLPLSVVVSNLVKFGIHFLLLAITIVYFNFNGYPLHFGLNILLILPLLVQLAALSLGLGIIISSLTTKYRDFSVLLSFVIQLWMYATPIVYPLSYLENKSFRWIIDMNPLTSIMESFRVAVFGVGTVDLYSVFYGIAFTIVVLLSGIVLFNRIEKTFLDTV